jgi:hypothetical protein
MDLLKAETDDEGEHDGRSHRERSQPRSRFEQRHTGPERNESESSSQHSSAAATKQPLERTRRAA